MSIVTTHNEEPKRLKLDLGRELAEPALPVEVHEPHDSYQVDALGQLHANVAKLQELQNKLSFMTKEISTLIR